jgi:hypothetical protein
MSQTVLFWNCNIEKGRLMLQEPDKPAIVARFVKRFAVDILILAECTLDSAELIAAFDAVELPFEETVSPHERLRFFLRTSNLILEPRSSDDRILVHRLCQDGFEDILIGAIHFYDRRNRPLPESRHGLVEQHYLTLLNAEESIGHQRTLLVGDFNMTPSRWACSIRDPALGR